MRLDGRALRAAPPAGRAPRRRRDDLPGAVAGAAPRWRRTSCSAWSRRARAAGALGGRIARDAAASGAARELAHPRHRRPTPSWAGCPSPRSSSSRSRGRVAVGCRVLVLDEPTSSLGRGRRRARCSTLVGRLRAAGPRGRLHLPLPRGGASASPTASPCCATAAPSAAARWPSATRGRDRRTDGRARASSSSFRAVARVRGRAAAGGRATSPAAGKPARASFTLRRGEVLGIAGLVGRGAHASCCARSSAWTRCVAGRVTLGGARRLRPAAPRALGAGPGAVSEDRKERRVWRWA